MLNDWIPLSQANNTSARDAFIYWLRLTILPDESVVAEQWAPMRLGRYGKRLVEIDEQGNQQMIRCNSIEHAEEEYQRIINSTPAYQEGYHQ